MSLFPLNGTSVGNGMLGIDAAVARKKREVRKKGNQFLVRGKRRKLAAENERSAADAHWDACWKACCAAFALVVVPLFADPCSLLRPISRPKRSSRKKRSAARSRTETEKLEALSSQTREKEDARIRIAR